MKIPKALTVTFIFSLLSTVLHATDPKLPAGVKQPDVKAGIAFIENKNQWNTQVKYKANLPGGELFLTGKGFTYSYYSLEDLERIHELGHDRPGVSTDNEIVKCHAYKVNFLGGNTDARVTPVDKKSYYHNYFLGNDQSKWAGNVSLFGQVTYEDLYPGIDAAIYSNEQSLKYDFIVAPNADASLIALEFEGATPQILPNGNLLIKTTVNEIEEGAPYVYQVVDGNKKTVKSHYVYNAKTGVVSFKFPEGYNKSLELVIDPNLVFGTYSGGTGNTYGFSATYDDDGNLYAGGQCFNSGWPTTTGAFQVTFASGQDAGINKYNALGTSLVYSTYFGGSGNDLPNNMVVNASNELVVCGSTTSGNLPTTTGAYSSTNSGAADIYVAHFNATGSALIGATYIGGSSSDGVNLTSLSPNYGDGNRGEVFTDATGNIYVASSTSSSNFPVTTGAYQTTNGGGQDGCILKLNPTCSSLMYSSYLGGSGDDACYALVLTSTGNIVTVGGTTSTNFPTTAGVVHATAQGGTDGFVSVLSTTTGLVSSSFLGTTAYDHAYKVQIDPSNNIYVMGQTSGAYPISTGVYNLSNGDIFIDKLSPTLNSSLLSTRMGNNQTNGQKFVPTAFLYDDCGNVYLCGFYPNATLPVSPNAFSTTGGFWLAVLETDFAGLVYATFIGGGDHVDGGTSRFDPKGIVYHSVCTANLNFPTNPSVWSPNKLAGGYDCASFKFNFEAMGVKAGFALGASSNDSGCAPHAVDFVNESIIANNYVWNFGDGSPTTTAASPSHTFTAPGTYTVSLHANNPVSCITDDTFYMDIHVFGADVPQLVTKDTVICLFQPTDITVEVTNPVSVLSYSWQPSNGVLSSPNLQTVTVDPSVSQDFTVTVTNTDEICSAEATASVHIDVFDPILFNVVSNDTVICLGESVPLHATGDSLFTYQWSPDIEVLNANSISTIATPTQSRDYMLTVTYGDCLPHQEAITVNVEPVPQVNAGPDQVICTYDTVQLFAAVLPSTFSAYSFQWSTSLNLSDSTIQAPVFDGDLTTRLDVTVKTPAGCTGKDTLFITVHPGDFLTASADTGVCPPAEVHLLSGGASTYSWSPAYGLTATNIADPVASPGTSTTYTVTGISQHNCVDSQQVVMDVYPRAVIALPDEVTIWTGEHYQMSPEGNCLYYSWFPSSGLSGANISNPLASPEVRTRYFVTAVTEHGCEVKDSIDILVNEEAVIDMPNAFAPGSSVNGTLKVGKRGIAQLKHFRIYNRWGNKVFETANIDEGWDGKFNNSAQPLGVYVYSIEAVTNKGKIFVKQGNITMVR